jgi:hypothetical protein
MLVVRAQPQTLPRHHVHVTAPDCRVGCVVGRQLGKGMLVLGQDGAPCWQVLDLRSTSTSSNTSC